MAHRARLSASLLVVTLAPAGALAQVGPGVPSLVDAVRHQDHAAVRSLLSQQIDVTAAQPDGATALH